MSRFKKRFTCRAYLQNNRFFSRTCAVSRGFFILFIAAVLVLAGCANTGAPSETGDVSPDSPSQGQDGNGSDSPQTAISRNPEDLFSDRDKEIGYDETESVSIRLEQDTASCDSAAVTISGSTVTITEEGTYLLSGSLEHGMVIIDAGKKDKIQIVLNQASIQCDSSAPLYVKQADKVFLTLAADSENTLTASGDFIAIDDNNIDAAIFSKDDLTLNGTGTLNIQSNYGHGIVSKDDLVVTSGTYQIKAARHGLSGKDSVCISDGDFTIIAGKDGIHGANDEDASLGFLYFTGGNFSISAEDDGFHSDADLTIQGGAINIKKSYEGIEGKSIDILGGTITIASSDDGLNASDGSGTEADAFQNPNSTQADDSIYIRIAGGTLTVDAEGDGIDSNGNFYVENGEVFVSGASNGGNGAFDYNGEAKITGGTVAATGFADMAQNFGDSSTQGTMLVSLPAQAAETEVSLKDSENNTLLSYTPAKQYNSVVFSHPAIVSGSNYTVHCGDTDTEITMDTLVYGSGHGIPGGPKNSGTMPGQAPSEGQDMPNGQTPPEGQNLPEGQTPPDKQDMPEGQVPNDGQNMPNGQTPPELPEGQTPSEPPRQPAPEENPSDTAENEA